MKPVLPYSVLWALVFSAQLPMLAIYFLRLYRDPIYGWWPLIIPWIAVALVWLRWDRQWQIPLRVLPLIGLSSGLVAALGAAVLRSDWLAGVGFVLTGGAFLAAHHQRDGSSLLPIWYLLWSVLRVPLNGNARLTGGGAEALERSIESILNLVQFPYVKFDSAVETLGHRYYYDQAVYSMLSWPLFVGVAMLYSAIWRRTWIEALLNVISAVAWCFAFQSGLLLTCIRFSVEADSWSMWWLAGLWAVVACGLFLSTERGLRILLQPISESSLDSRLANPFVLAWNWCFSPRSLRANSQRLGERWFSRSSSWMLVGVVVLTLLLQLVQAPGALAALSLRTRLVIDAHKLQEFVFKKGEEYEYRHTFHSPPLIVDREVDIWTVYAPLSMTEHMLCIQPQAVFDLEALILSIGGQVDSNDHVPATLPNGQLFTYGSITFINGRQPAHLYYIWLTADGSPLEPTQYASSGYLLMSQAEFVKVYGATTKRILLTEFSRFVVGVQSQMIESTRAP